jgi:hypothetical protein
MRRVSKDGRVLGRACCHPSRRALKGAPQDEVRVVLISLEKAQTLRKSAAFGGASRRIAAGIHLQTPFGNSPL